MFDKRVVIKTALAPSIRKSMGDRHTLLEKLEVAVLTRVNHEITYLNCCHRVGHRRRRAREHVKARIESVDDVYRATNPLHHKMFERGSNISYEKHGECV
jgi:hypothetical protein